MSRKKGSAPFSLFAFQDAITSVCGVIVLITLMLALNLTRQALVDAQSYENAIVAEEINQQIQRLQETLKEAQTPTEEEKFLIEAASFSLGEIEKRAENTKQKIEDAKIVKEKIEKEAERIALLKEKTEKQKQANIALNKKIKDLEDEKLATETQKNDLLLKNVAYAFPNDGTQLPWFVDISQNHIIAVGKSNALNFQNPSQFLNWAKKRPNSEYFVLIARPSGTKRFGEIRRALEEMNMPIGVDLVGETRELTFLGFDKEDSQP